MNRFHFFEESLAKVLAPRRCLSCETLVDETLFCRRCGELVLELHAPWTQRVPSPLQELRFGFEYGCNIAEAILQLKYSGRTDVGWYLGQHLATKLPAGPAWLVPVPIHPGRARKRGYNQTDWLARGIQSVRPELKPVRLLRRRGQGSSQRGRTRLERRKEIRNAFALRKPGISLQGRKIWLVDDVCVTGATLQACAKTLAHAGSDNLCGIAAAVSV